MNIIELDRWRTPASSYPRQILGEARVKTALYAPGVYGCYMQRGYEYFQARRRLYVTALQIEGETWMVDDPPHWWAMQEHAQQLSGRVLCVGLGLGLIVWTLDANPAVEKIIVVERSRDVIDLVGPLVPQGKLEIVEQDFWTVNGADHPADGALFDLFVGNAWDFLSQAGEAVCHIWREWGEDINVRVHGFSQAMVLAIAHSMRERYGDSDVMKPAGYSGA